MTKIRIEHNTVQETLVIPLYGRKMCTERFPNLFRLMARLGDGFMKMRIVSPALHLTVSRTAGARLAPVNSRGC